MLCLVMQIVKADRGTLYNSEIVDTCVHIFEEDGFTFSSKF